MSGPGASPTGVVLFEAPEAAAKSSVVKSRASEVGVGWIGTDRLPGSFAFGDPKHSVKARWDALNSFNVRQPVAHTELPTLADFYQPASPGLRDGVLADQQVDVCRCEITRHRDVRPDPPRFVKSSGTHEQRRPFRLMRA